MLARNVLRLLMVLGSISGAAAQSPMSPNSAPPPLPPRVAAQPPAMSPDMKTVLDAQMALGTKPIELLTPVKARLQPSPADGARAVMRQRGMSTAPDTTISTRDVSYGDDPMQHVRVYKPAATSAEMMPLIIYFHGGGWVIADVNTYDATPRLLSKQLGAIVVSVEYRHAPEAKFPAQHEDAATAYRWVLEKAASWGGDPTRVALAGESAGGNLAVATAIYARDNGLTKPLHVLAVYPIANSATNLASRVDSANAKPLNSAMLPWFGHYYATSKTDMMDPRLNLVKADLRDLPMTTIINARIDPLRSDGETLATAMQSAGNRVEQRTFEGVTHEFFGLGTLVRGAYDAEQYAISRLRAAFDKRR